MNEQLSLFGVLPRMSPEQASRAAFDDFHRKNPHVMQELIGMALDLKRNGIDEWGIGALFEVLRFRRAMKTTGDEFKLNNNYRAFYSRKLMDAVPELKNFFRVRGSVADQEEG